MEREVGGGVGMGNTCKPMAVSFQCMTKFATKKKKNPPAHAGVPGSIPDLETRSSMLQLRPGMPKKVKETNLEVWIFGGNVLAFQTLATNSIIKECVGQLKHVYGPCLIYSVPSGVDDFFFNPLFSSSLLGHGSLPFEMFLWDL